MAVTTRVGRPEPNVVLAKPARKLPWAIAFYRSAVGRKWTMGLTGLLLLGFVIFHALGNLKLFIGAEEIDSYGEALRDLGNHLVPRTHLLWGLRIGLIVAFAVHIHAAYSLTAMNWKARPTKYKAPRDYQSVTFASRTMRWTGTIVLIYLFIHLADLTWGWLNPDWERGHVYDNVVTSLSRWPMAIIYMIGATAVAIHVYHGASSMVQSLGITNPRIQGLRQPIAIASALFLLIINLSFPIAVLAGIVE